MLRASRSRCLGMRQKIRLDSDRIKRGPGPLYVPPRVFAVAKSRQSSLNATKDGVWGCRGCFASVQRVRSLLRTGPKGGTVGTVAGAASGNTPFSVSQPGGPCGTVGTVAPRGMAKCPDRPGLSQATGQHFFQPHRRDIMEVYRLSRLGWLAKQRAALPRSPRSPDALPRVPNRGAIQSGARSGDAQPAVPACAALPQPCRCD